MLTLIRELPAINHVRYGLYKCHCGQTATKRLANVISGNTSSCGCRSTAQKNKRCKKGFGRNQEQAYVLPPQPEPYKPTCCCNPAPEKINGKWYKITSLRCPVHFSKSILDFKQNAERKQSHVNRYYSGGK